MCFWNERYVDRPGNEGISSWAAITTESTACLLLLSGPLFFLRRNRPGFFEGTRRSIVFTRNRVSATRHAWQYSFEGLGVRPRGSPESYCYYHRIIGKRGICEPTPYSVQVQYKHKYEDGQGLCPCPSRSKEACGTRTLAGDDPAQYPRTDNLMRVALWSSLGKGLVGKGLSGHHP